MNQAHFPANPNQPPLNRPPMSRPPPNLAGGPESRPQHPQARSQLGLQQQIPRPNISGPQQPPMQGQQNAVPSGTNTPRPHPQSQRQSQPQPPPQFQPQLQSQPQIQPQIQRAANPPIQNPSIAQMRPAPSPRNITPNLQGAIPPSIQQMRPPQQNVPRPQPPPAQPGFTNPSIPNAQRPPMQNPNVPPYTQNQMQVPQQQNINQLSQQFGNMNVNAQVHSVPSHKPRRVYAADNVSPQTQPRESAAISSPQMFTPAAQPPKPNSSFARTYVNQNNSPAMAPGLEPQKPRIDPSQMPSPIAVQALNQEIFRDLEFSTSSKSGIPLATTQFTCIDDGNSNPRYIRLSMSNIPNSENLLKDSQLPLGMIITPLADLGDNDTQLQTVDFGAEGPIRCIRCKAYINTYMTFIDGGKRFVCNLCSHENDVPEDYFCNLDMAGRRLDLDTRPELRSGSCEFVATKEFMSSQSGPAAFIFAIDVTWESIQNGMVHTAVAAIKETLYSGMGLPYGTLFGIMTYDRSVHFYNLNNSLDSAQMLVVSDIRDMFLPLKDGLLVDPYESRSIIESLLDSIPTLFSSNRTAEPVLGSVVTAAHEALKGRGGKLFLFQSSMPTYGPGALRHRDDIKLHNTDKEKTLFVPNDTFYRDIAIQYVGEGISVSLYMFSNSYVDLASMMPLVQLTSGECFVYYGFKRERDSPSFFADLRADATRNFGFNGVLRVRCSDGLRVDEYYGNLYMRNHVDVELAGVASDCTIGVTFKHDSQLDETKDVYFQIALLYTSSDGKRLIRVHNAAVPCTTLIGNMFKFSELDTSMSLLARISVAETAKLSLRNIRDNVFEKCVQILLAYRKHCASGSPPGQLILPEAYKLLPLYALSLIKSFALKGGTDVPVDLRVLHMSLLRSMPVYKSVYYFYPRIAAIGQLPALDNESAGETPLIFSQLVRATYSAFDPAGVYLVQTNSASLTLWIGRQVDSQVLHSLFGVDSAEKLSSTTTCIPILNNELNINARSVAIALSTSCNYLLPADQVNEYKSLDDAGSDDVTALYLPPIQILRQGIDPQEISFVNILVEDKNNDGMSYVDFLCHIHRQIQIALKPKRN
ncbi:hypothetical protein BB560_001461 [Smittium megazygosporum]|uniref:Uncharacterized protein n=1 Tax=Smittium megazygosporum TaxID=133381 RepID=A0A2T9ZHI0_9FUNG|nr:hypothetical protein BB560_001461 [Smittium megazygosporum]